MLKMTIDGEEVVSKNNFTIKEEMLSPSSTILNNTYPKTWEDDKDYTSRFYYPKDYAKLDIQNFSITPEEAGTTIDIIGSATLTDVDTTKESRVLRLLGQTSQTGTPTPSSPIPINVVSGDNEINICGKNLFVPTLKVDDTNISATRCTVSLSGDEYTFSATGTDMYFGNIVASGTSYQNVFGTLYDVEDITNLVFKPTNTDFDKNYVCFYDKNKVSLGFNQINNSTGLITPVTNTKYIGFRIGKGASVSGTSYSTKFQLEKGSTATTYEPYIGNTYPLYLGVENLFSGTLYNTQVASNGGIASSTNRIANVNVGGTSSTYLQAGTYTLSIPNLDYCTALTKNSGGTILDNFANSWQTLPFTFTLTQAGYLYFTGRKSDNSTITASDYTAQVNKGSQVNHISTTPIELCKIGTYQDYIYKEDGKWYLHKEIGKVVLDGTINWTLNQEATYVNQYLMSGTNLSEDVASGTSNIMSDYFKYKQGNPSSSTNEDYMWLYQKKLVLDVRKTIVSDASGLKTWVGNNKPTIYYQLATPTNTEITNTTLLEQLDALESQ